MRVSELRRKHGISEDNCYKWNSKSAGIEASDLKWTKELEAENAKPKRICADAALEDPAMREQMATNRRASYETQRRALSGRGTRPSGRPIMPLCGTVAIGIGLGPEQLTVLDAQVIGALATLVNGRPSRESWKCRKILRRQGRAWNHKRIFREYKRMNLHLRRPTNKQLPNGDPIHMAGQATPERVHLALQRQSVGNPAYELSS